MDNLYIDNDRSRFEVEELLLKNEELHKNVKMLTHKLKYNRSKLCDIKDELVRVLNSDSVDKIHKSIGKIIKNIG